MPEHHGTVPGDLATIEAVSAHIGKYIGAVDKVFHEIESPDIHVDVHHVPPSSRCSNAVLVTSGMSELPMSVPNGAEEYRFAEVFALLPPDWPLTADAFENEDNYWPMRLLKTLARYPHDHGTWLGYGHSIGNAGVPFAPSTQLCGVVLVNPISLPDEFGTLVLPEARTVHLWQAIPLYQEELDYKVQQGAEALLRLFQESDVSDVIGMTRQNVCVGGGRTSGIWTPPVK